MKFKDFDLARTLECGQCFNFTKLGEQEYEVRAFGRILHVCQRGEELDFGSASGSDISDIWIPYFDLERDYGEINRALIKADPRFEEIISANYGIRILNQEFFETLISFIISQNNNIPRIRKIVAAISECGTFPSLEELSKMSEQDFRALGAGFRAPYIINGIDYLKTCDEKALRAMTFSEAKAELMKIKGVGDKVANCALLFSLGFRDAFPVDVWIKRIMEHMYFGCETDKGVIEAFAREKFGAFGGYAQQYLFMHAKK